MNLESEQQAAGFILLMHLRMMAGCLRKLPEDKWDFTFAISAPTPRTLAHHTLHWLQCDRQHINNPDVKSHKPIPACPTTPTEICDALSAEADAWETLINGLKPEDWDRPGRQFGIETAKMNVRGFVNHMIQNTIYKNGQFSTIFYALGLDGEGPYEAPFPNEIYKEVLGIG